jgi:hypothetical protein
MGDNLPPPFLTKTYDLVDDPGTDPVVSWGSQGTSFIVHKVSCAGMGATVACGGCTGRRAPRMRRPCTEGVHAPPHARDLTSQPPEFARDLLPRFFKHNVGLRDVGGRRARDCSAASL